MKLKQTPEIVNHIVTESQTKQKEKVEHKIEKQELVDDSLIEQKKVSEKS